MKCKKTISDLVQLRVISLLICIIPGMATGETVSVFCNPATPQHTFAAGDIQKALEAKNFKVEIKDLSTLADSYTGKKVVIALASNAKVTTLLTTQGGSTTNKVGEQAYAMRTTTAPQLSYWVLGGDDNGAMYGGLEIAENIKHCDFTGTYNVKQSPYVLNRGVKANLPLDKRSPTYFGPGSGSGFGGTAAQKAIPHVWDIHYWKEWFDEMARSRFNVLTIWNCHPFPALGLDMPESFTDVQYYDGSKKTMSKADKVAFWKEVMAYGKGRGFKIYFVSWNIYTYGTGLSTSPSNQTTQDYMRKAVRMMFETFPDLDGLGVSAGENMSGMSTQEKADWLAATYGNGIADYAQSHPSRKITFLHRFLDMEVSVVKSEFSMFNSLGNVNLDMSFKYSVAHMYSTPDPAWIFVKDSYNAYNDLKANNEKTWLELRNDDFYFLSWGDPQFARDFIAGFSDIEDVVTGFMYGGDGWVRTRDFTSKSAPFKGMLEVNRDWFSYRIWGRLSYNPQTSNEVFINEMAYRYPGVDVQTLFDAWTGASRGVSLAAELVMGSVKGGDGSFWWDWQWWPELCTDQSGLVKISKFISSPPADRSTLCSIKNTASGNCSGKSRTSYVVADTIETTAQDALKKISSLDAKGYADLVLYQKNITAHCYLSLYYAKKIRGATDKSANDITSARAAMGEAYCYWINYTTIMNELHTGANMERTKDFSDWSVYNSSVLGEYTDLGGVGIPCTMSLPVLND
jgi:hypothetical protein